MGIDAEREAGLEGADMILISMTLVLISMTTIGLFFLLVCWNITEREAVREAREVLWVYGSPAGHLNAGLGGLDVDTAMLTLQLHLVAIRADDLAHRVLAEASGRARTF